MSDNGEFWSNQWGNSSGWWDHDGSSTWGCDGQTWQEDTNQEYQDEDKTMGSSCRNGVVKASKRDRRSKAQKEREEIRRPLLIKLQKLQEQKDLAACRAVVPLLVNGR